MKMMIDPEARTLTYEVDGVSRGLPLYSKEAFELLSLHWLRVGWNQKYPYTFSWLGRPIIQLPEDMVRVQEVIYRIRPDVIIETGVAHGGSLVFYASLCKVMGKGRVIGVDVEIRPHNRTAIEAHELASYITLIEGNSIDPDVVARVKSFVRPGEGVLVILDSCHTKEHVLNELEAYHGLVSRGSYIIATDGNMKDLSDVPHGDATWAWSNPFAAAAQFAGLHPEFVIEQPPWPFNESQLTQNVTHWPGAWLKRQSPC
jgi:cephalosporin hydroxylase